MNAAHRHRARIFDSQPLSSGKISLEIEENRYRLEDGRRARQAFSCLIEPQAGDEVLVFDGEESFVVAVLARPQAGEAVLTVPGARALSIRQPRIALDAVEHAALRSGRDLELTAATGTLALNARDLFTTVAGSLVENVRHYVGRVEQYLLEARGLLRLHGEQALVTAEKDVKVDAERISMG